MEKIKIYWVAVLVFSSMWGFAQGNKNEHNIHINIPEVAMLDLESTGSKEITLSPVVSNEAGAPVDFTNIKDNTIWINYSSIIGSTTEQSRNVVVSVSDEIPAGVNLKVHASEYSGNGKGEIRDPNR